MKIIDSSKILAHLRCRRYYYYRYVRHWKPERPSIHLEFGQAWHLMKEAVLLGTPLDEAYEKFLLHYREFFPETMDEANSPKNPAGAFMGITSYVEKYGIKPFDEVLHTEVGGLVPITPDTQATFRIDAIVRHEDKLWVLDHKTGSRLTKQWEDQWHLSIQMFIYIHALEFFYGADNVGGAIIDGTIFRKKDCEHIRVTVPSRSPSHRALHWSIAHYLDLIDWDHEALENATEDLLPAFPMNPESCHDFGATCPYYDLCRCWECPHMKSNPGGFIEEEWDPLKALEGTKKLENPYE